MGGTGTPVSNVPNERKLDRTKSVYANITDFPAARVKMYSPPRQITKWGSNQVLKHVGWGELFFDLFYVSGFYNLGGILVEAPSLMENLYFLACIFTLLQLWHEKTFFDARFTYGDDVFHKVTDSIFLLIIAVAVANIAVASKMSRPSAYDNMFIYSLMMFFGTLFSSLRYVETYFFGKGQERNIKWSSRLWIMKMIPTMGFYLAATVISGMEYFGKDGDYTNEPYLEKDDNSTTEVEADKNRLLFQVFRELADSSSSASLTTDDCNDINFMPMLLLYVGFASGWLVVIFGVCFCMKNNEETQKYTIPLNADYAIHRYGEVIMLILGESVLSLLIVDSSNYSESLYWQIFFAGVMTLILLQFCHYRSMPHDPESHAFWNHNKRTVMFVLAFQTYSAALIMVGASYKIFLKSIKNKSGDDKKRLLLEQTQELFPQYFNDEGKMRYLADESEKSEYQSYEGGSFIDYCFGYWWPAFYQAEIDNGNTTEWYIADLFGWGFACTFLFLYVMIITNNGLKKQLKIWKKKPLVAVVIVLIRLALIGFMFFVSWWKALQDFHILAWIGFGAVAIQLTTRMLEDVIFFEEDHYHDHEDEYISEESSVDVQNQESQKEYA